MAYELPRPVIDDLQLLTSELVSNCVRHGNTDRRGQVRIDMATPDGVVRVGVSTNGSGFELVQPVDDPHSPGASAW